MCQCCIENVPELEKSDAILFLILNVIVSGLGTFVLGLKQGQSGEDIKKTGIIQFILSFFIVGWFWSVYWGITLVQKSSGDINIKYATIKPTESVQVNIEVKGG